MTTIYLTGDYEYNQYRVSDLDAGTVIDAYGATFVEDNNKADDGKANPYPVVIRDSADVTLRGGTVLGNVDQTTDREIIYNYALANSAAVRAEDSPNIIIQNWRIDNAWDGIRVSWNTENFLIEDVWITDARDDAIENDRLNSGTIRDCLFDGVMNGISLDPSSSSPVDGSGQDVAIDGVLMRMKTYLSDGELTHGSPIKVDKSLSMPDLHITNSVFAIEDVNHNGLERLAIAWSNLVESHGNVFLNLSDTPLPKDYPMPPTGWTVLQGQAARDYWSSARDKWVADHADTVPHLASDDMVSQRIDPTPTDPDPTLVDPTLVDPTPVEPAPVDLNPTPSTSSLTPTFSGEKFKGGSASETIVGNSLDNVIYGGSGNDIIHGGAGDDLIRSGRGADVLWGDSGHDIFWCKAEGDSRASTGIDMIMDFVRGVDKIDLSDIDANRSVTGNQAFKFGNIDDLSVGRLGVKYDRAHDYTVIQANVDGDSRIEIEIHLDGQHALTASDFFL